MESKIKDTNDLICRKEKKNSQPLKTNLCLPKGTSVGVDGLGFSHCGIWNDLPKGTWCIAQKTLPNIQ